MVKPYYYLNSSNVYCIIKMYSEHTIEPENHIELAFKGKREHIVTLNIPNRGYPWADDQSAYSSRIIRYNDGKRDAAAYV